MCFTDCFIITCSNLTLNQVQTVPGTARVQLRTGRSLSHMCTRTQTHEPIFRTSPRGRVTRLSWQWGLECPRQREAWLSGVTGDVMWSSGSEDPSKGNAINYDLTSFLCVFFKLSPTQFLYLFFWIIYQFVFSSAEVFKSFLLPSHLRQN